MHAALLIVDMQQAIDHPSWSRDGGRNHPNAELAALRLIESWRDSGRAVYHVRHDSVEPASTYRPGQPGHAFKPGFEPREGEPVIAKHTGSAFTATALEDLLRTHGHTELVVAGVITNNSVETTVRHASTLGFNVALTEDACFTFARRDWDGVLHTAQSVHAMSLANLDGEYCRVVSSAEVLASAGSRYPVLPYFERVSRDGEKRAIAAVVEYVTAMVAGARGEATEQFGLMVTCSESLADRLAELGFQPHPNGDQRMRAGAVAHAGLLWRIEVRTDDRRY